MTEPYDPLSGEPRPGEQSPGEPLSRRAARDAEQADAEQAAVPVFPESADPATPAAPTEAYQPPADPYQPVAEPYLPPTEAYQPPTEAYRPAAEPYLPPTEAYQPPTEAYQAPTQAYRPPTQGHSPDLDPTLVVPAAVAQPNPAAQAYANFAQPTEAFTSAPAAAAPPAGGGPGDGGKTGIAGLFERHRPAAVAVSIGVAFLLLGTGAVVAGAAAGTKAPITAEAAAQLPDAEQPDRAVPDSQPDPSLVRTCSIRTAASADALGKLRGSVINTSSGDVIYSAGGSQQAAPAGTMQLITASAAISVLGPDYRMTTKVYRSSEPGTIVLVGAGDPTLSNTDPGSQSYYKDAPKLSALVDQVRTALGAEQPIAKIILDASYWDPSDAWDESWSSSARRNGTMSEVTALQVDGDREDPTAAKSPRSDDPIDRAGQLFAAKLGFPDAELVQGTVDEGSEEIAHVDSQPISVLVNTMLQTGDYTLAESIARVTSKESNGDGSAGSLPATFGSALTQLGLDPADVLVKDASGLSKENAVPAKFMAQLSQKILEGTNKLNNVYNSLPVAGVSGTLLDRFTGDNEKAREAVIAATGATGSESSLSGTIKAQDGSTLVFAFYALDDSIDAAAAALAIDTLTTRAFECGDNLTAG